MENDPIKLLYTCVYCHKKRGSAILITMDARNKLGVYNSLLCLIVPQVKLVFVAALRYKFGSLVQ